MRTKLLLLVKLIQNVKIKVIVADETRLEWCLIGFVQIKVVDANKLLIVRFKLSLVVALRLGVTLEDCWKVYVPFWSHRFSFGRCRHAACTLEAIQLT